MAPVIVCAGIVTDTTCPPLTVATLTVCGTVVGAVYVVPGMTVVNVMYEPRAEAGIAPPTPVPVNCGGIERVAVFGLSCVALAYMFPWSFPLV